MNERQKGFCELVVARGNTSELLDAAEESLDQIATLVEMPVERTGVDSVGARRDDRLGTLCRDCFDEGVRVVPLVGHNEFGRLSLDQGFGLLDIRDLPRRVLVGTNDGRVDKELLQVGIAA